MESKVSKITPKLSHKELKMTKEKQNSTDRLNSKIGEHSVLLVTETTGMPHKCFFDLILNHSPRGRNRGATWIRRAVLAQPLGVLGNIVKLQCKVTCTISCTVPFADACVSKAPVT